jgi:hypothetical protein
MPVLINPGAMKSSDRLHGPFSFGLQMAATDQNSAADPVMQFWGDFMSRMGQAPGSSASAAASNESAKQMQRIFLDALAKYCDEFMRSEQFLGMMKQTMDRSLAFKQQVDQFLTGAYQSAQAPSRSDTDHIAGLLRSVEHRLLARLDEVDQRVAAVEDTRSTGKGAGASRAPRPSKRVTAKKRSASGKRKR